MKPALLAAIVLCTTAALGQAIGGALPASSMANVYQMTTHAQHASPQQMAQEQSLFAGAGSITMAQGERPLWEVAPPDPPYVPLGDTARMLKKQHESTKKAQFVFEN
jgi:hypothetical protein